MSTVCHLLSPSGRLQIFVRFSYYFAKESVCYFTVQYGRVNVHISHLFLSNYFSPFYDISHLKWNCKFSHDIKLLLTEKSWTCRKSISIEKCYLILFQGFSLVFFYLLTKVGRHMRIGITVAKNDLGLLAEFCTIENIQTSVWERF